MTWHRLFLTSALVASCLGWQAHAHASTTLLGANCVSDQDCEADGLLCWLPSGELGLEGPSGGLCTAHCDFHDDCWALDPTAVCNDDGMCLEGCVLGVEQETKCHGRADVACIEWGGDPTCHPLCTGDASCGEDLFCNPVTGLCGSSAAPGAAPGTSCDPFGPDICAGSCRGVCLESCVMGRGSDCARTAKVSSLGAACLAPWQGGAVGDLGACLPLCNCSGECPDAMLCVAADLGDGYDAAGVCTAGPRIAAASDCIDDARAGECPNGPLRACRSPAGCLGTAECLPSGEYGDCHCQEPANVSGAGGEAGASASDAAAAGAGGNADAVKEPPRQPVGERSSCIASGSPGSRGHWLLGLGLLLSVQARRWRRVRARQTA